MSAEEIKMIILSSDCWFNSKHWNVPLNATDFAPLKHSKTDKRFLRW